MRLPSMSSVAQTSAFVVLLLVLYLILDGCDPRIAGSTVHHATHAHLAKLKAQRLVKKELQEEVAALDKRLEELRKEKRKLAAAQQDAADQQVENSVQPWEFVTDSIYYLTESAQMSMAAHVYTSAFAERRLELSSLLASAKELADSMAKKTESQSSLRYSYGFLKFDPVQGLDGEFHYSGSGGAMYALRAARDFGPPVVVATETLNKYGAHVHMVMPLSGRLDKLAFFLDTFLQVYASDSSLFLTIVYFGWEGMDEAQAMTQKKLAERHAQKPVYRFIRHEGKFSRGVGLQHGAFSNDSWPVADPAATGSESALPDRKSMLLFFIDVDILFDEAALVRCRLLTERGRRVYYPIVFSQYNPEVAYRHLDEAPELRDRTEHNYTSGFWRSFGFGMACVHYADFNASGGFDLNIKGWGAEDVMLYRKFIAQRKVQVMRAVDPGLFHIFHEKVCDKTLNAEQMRMCQGTKGVNEASPEQMGYLLYK
ncbi:chondroitin sulfate N-acetylgalactosaminyltransferase 1-like [Sycon ciliatum]|uniref:chondroitin sulfate N-acetylgalactosaminyltransferase 1-like n=1 Tax=Sycon ciliatum TaxID=27933 RepID=UPI0031F6715A